MSELTPCNCCTLAEITRRAAERGATVTTTRPPLRGDERTSWIEVHCSDKPEPVAFFLELTTYCCC